MNNGFKKIEKQISFTADENEKQLLMRQKNRIHVEITG